MCTINVDFSQVQMMLIQHLGWTNVSSVEFDQQLNGYFYLRSSGKKAFVFSKAVLGFSFRYQPVPVDVVRLEI